MAKLLVVDDEPAIQLLMQAILSQEGHDVSTASDGLEALVAVERQMPDVVLLDLMMPNMDGWRFLEELRRRELRQKVRVIIVSATADVDSVERAHSEGVREHLAKPFNPDAVLRAVSAVLQEPPEDILARREHPEDLVRLIDKLQTLDD